MRTFVQTNEDDTVVAIIRSSTTDPCPDNLIEITDVRSVTIQLGDTYPPKPEEEVDL